MLQLLRDLNAHKGHANRTLVEAVRGHGVAHENSEILDLLQQVCLHSHGHRAQIARIYRALGGTPPMMDFIVWVAQRKAGM